MFGFSFYALTVSSNHHRLLAALIFLACAGAYFLTRTPALDEWDSVQFALGVGDFDLWKHQPHPPGYPLYIAAGWLAHHLLPLDVPNALQLVSALGGGLFVACWFVMIARPFGMFTAWVCTAALGTLLITWMSATKVLTDPAGAGLLALTLLLADTSRRRENDIALPPTDRWLAATAIAGAVDVGVRPQNIGVVLLILVLTILAVRRPSMRQRWTLGLGAFLVVGLLWLLPTMLIQARAPEANGDPLAYPRLLLMQWRWRLDQPKAYIGAEGPAGGESMWLYRADHHVLGLLTRGFGFELNTVRGWSGIVVLVAGWAFYALRDRVRWLLPPLDDEGPRAFWRQHLPWVVVYYLIIFCFLPGDQRYYLPIFPLLILPAVLGWRGATMGDGWLALVIPVVTLMATSPFIGPNHTEPAPPVQMIRWLQARHPPTERPHMWLMLHDSLRHARWYAPDYFVLRSAIPGELQEGWLVTDDPVIGPTYTDNPAEVAVDPGNWKLVRTFHRSPLIYRKHNTVYLYRFIGSNYSLRQRL